VLGGNGEGAARQERARVTVVTLKPQPQAEAEADVVREGIPHGIGAVGVAHEEEPCALADVEDAVVRVIGGDEPKAEGAVDHLDRDHGYPRRILLVHQDPSRSGHEVEELGTVDGGAPARRWTVGVMVPVLIVWRCGRVAARSQTQQEHAHHRLYHPHRRTSTRDCPQVGQ
jgi:hypothetical protein